MIKAIVLLAAALIMAEAGHPAGVVYPFPIDTILTCREPDGAGGIREVPTPTVPIIPGEADEVWLPEAVRFRPPGGTIDAPWLIPELPGGIIEGVHILNCEGLNTTTPGPGTMNPIGSADRPPPVDVFNVSNMILEGLGFFNAAEQAVIRSFWDEVGFLDCDEPIFEVTQLPSHYYPPCYPGGRCSGETCSVPEGQRCQPSLRDTALFPFFRWDCCWDYDGVEWRWACGMYLVNIQIISQCFCSCRPVFI